MTFWFLASVTNLLGNIIFLQYYWVLISFMKIIKLWSVKVNNESLDEINTKLNWAFNFSSVELYFDRGNSYKKRNLQIYLNIKYLHWNEMIWWSMKLVCWNSLYFAFKIMQIMNAMLSVIHFLNLEFNFHVPVILIWQIKQGQCL